MRTESIKVKLRDGTMGAYVAYPDKTPVGAIIAIMEIWGVNDTMRHHAHEFAEAGFVCLVPDLFWRQEPGVELSDHNPDHVQKAFDLYYEFDYDLGVRDMEDTWHYLAKIPECNGKVGSVGYCLGGKLCYLMCCRTDIDCAVAYYGTYIEHRIREAKNLHRPFVLHMAMKDRWVQAEVNDLLERRLAPTPLVTIHKYPGADHAFARKGGKTYSKPEADRAVGLGLGIGLAALARERVVGAGILVDRHQRGRREPPLEQVVHLGLHPAVLHRHVQHERAVQVLRLLDAVLDIRAIVGDRAVDLGAAAHQVAELAAQAVADRADLAVALRQLLEEVPGVLHVAHREVVVEVVVEIERLSHVLGIAVRELDAGLLPPEQVGHQADEAGLGELVRVMPHCVVDAPDLHDGDDRAHGY